MLLPDKVVSEFYCERARTTAHALGDRFRRVFETGDSIRECNQCPPKQSSADGEIRTSPLQLLLINMMELRE